MKCIGNIIWKLPFQTGDTPDQMITVTGSVCRSTIIPPIPGDMDGIMSAQPVRSVVEQNTG